MSGEANSARLVDFIGNKILEGEMPPGTKLTEASLAEELGVSRAPLREALLKLEERQLIERVPYSGMRVARLSQADILQMYEIREVLEGLACRKAASRISAEDIRKLNAYVDASEARLASPAAADSRTLSTIGDFHDEIARIGENEQLRKMLGREVWKFLRVNYQLRSRTQERLAEAVVEHRRIIEALEARDAELSELLMRRHIAKAREGVLGDNQ